MKKPSKSGVGPRRTRKAVNITLSEEARRMGEQLAQERGIRFTQLVEQLLRGELREAGLLKREGGDKG